MMIFESKRGAALILVFIILIGLSGIAFAFLAMLSDEIGSAGAGLKNMQAFYIAEAGLAKARWALTVGEETVPWSEEDTEVQKNGTTLGTYTVNAADDNGDGSVTTITSEGYIPDDTNPLAKRQVVEADIAVGSGDLTNLSLAATISASSEKLPQNPATKANDGDSGTNWKAGSKDDAWLKLDFGSSTTFTRVVYTGGNINSVTIEHSDNDSDYTAVTTPVESPAGTVNFVSASGRYLKFSMDVDSSRTADVDELETYDADEEVSATLGQGEFSTSW